MLISGLKLKSKTKLNQKFEAKVWSQTKLNLHNPVSDGTTVMHLDTHLSVIR